MVQTDRPLAQALRLYYIAVFGALGVYLPFFPRWLEGRGIEGLQMGLVMATAPAMGLVGPPAFGLLADAFGLRGLLLRGACFVAFLSFAAIGAGEALWQPLGFGLLFAAVLVASLFRSVLIPLGDVIAMEHSRTTGRGYAGIRLWGSVGFLASVLAAGRWLDPKAPADLPLWVAAGLLAATLLAWALPKRGAAPLAPSQAGLRDLLGARDFRLFLATWFLAQLAHSSYDMCYSLHLRDLGADEELIGLAWALGVLCEIALMARAEPLFRRFAPRHLVVCALAGAALRWALLGQVRSLGVLLALQPLHALSFGLLWIASLAWIRDRAPAQSLATAQGLFSAASAAGLVLGLLLWSELYSRRGGAPTFSAAALAATGALALAVVWSRGQRVAG